MEFNINNL